MSDFRNLTPLMLGADKKFLNVASPDLTPLMLSNLRKTLGLNDSAYQAHHLVPYAIARDSEAIMFAVKNKLYDINRKENGIALPKSKELAVEVGLPQHSGSHGNYSAEVKAMVNKLDADFALGRLSQTQLMARIADIESRARATVLLTSGRLK